MKKISIESKTVYGLKVRTSNSSEQDPKSAKIGDLWKVFYKRIFMNIEQPSMAYGVYTNYESDHNGDFDIVAAVESPRDKSDLSKLDLKSGTYLVFENEGQMPEAIIEAWQDVWSFFSNKECEYTRAYQTDFETYTDDKSVKIYIGIK
jgi:predicted transcriptional regulator YdeE